MTEQEIGDFIRTRGLTLKVKYAHSTFEVSLTQGPLGAYVRRHQYEGAIEAAIFAWMWLHEGT